jgi:hypothetical protein
MMAVFVAIAAVAVERLINRRRLKLHEVLADVGWLTLIFAAIEFAYLFFVEAATLNYRSAVSPLWYTEWGTFKNLLLDAAIGVMLIFASVWLESAGIELRRPRLSMGGVKLMKEPKAGSNKLQKRQNEKCNIEWHEAS